MGDFNATWSTLEKEGGDCSISTAMRQFNECLYDIYVEDFLCKEEC